MAVVLVTGASSGTGAAIAVAFADEGWSVMATGRDEARLDELADQYDDVATWAGELRDAEDCDELVADTLDEFGQLDCLVNSAGILTRGSAAEIDIDDWRDTISINLEVPFYLSRAALPHLAESTGCIINIGCLRGLMPGRRAVAYATSKAGLIMLTRAMARDHAAEGVRCNIICPGDVDTPMLAAGADDAGKDVGDYLENLASQIPDGRLATPEDIAALAWFLASDAASHINGAVIPVDGGMSS